MIALPAQEIDEGDQAILESFMPNAGGTRNLADLIMEKIQAREAGEEQPVEGERSSVFAEVLFISDNLHRQCRKWQEKQVLTRK